MNLRNLADTWELTESSSRYNFAADEIGRDNLSLVLEVGPAAKGIGRLLFHATVIYTDILENFGDGEDALRVRASVAELPYNDNSFSHVVCLDMLEHISCELRAQAIAEIYRVTAPGGKLILSAPIDPEATAADAWLQEQIFNKGGDTHQWVSEHIEYGVPTLEDFEKWISELEPMPREVAIHNDLSVEAWKNALEVVAIPGNRIERVVAMARFVFHKFAGNKKDQPIYRKLITIKK